MTLIKTGHDFTQLRANRRCPASLFKMSAVILWHGVRRYPCFMKKVSIKQVTFAHQSTLRGLEFYELELRFLQKRLEEIAADNTGREVAEKIETFQNQFIIHRDQIGQLKHRLNEHLQLLEQSLGGSGNYVDAEVVKNGTAIDSDYATEEELFKNMRQEFNRFAAAWM
jgi:hypothetical protein